MKIVSETQWFKKWFGPLFRTIVIDTIKKEIRSHALIFMFIISTISLLVVFQVLKTVSGQFGGGNAENVIQLSFNIVFWSINLMSVFFTTILGVSAFRSDFKEKIFYTILTLPISRFHYFYGRIIGVWLMGIAYYLYNKILGTILLSLLYKKFFFNEKYLLAIPISALALFVCLNISGLLALYFRQLGAIFLTLIFFLLNFLSYNYWGQVTFDNAFKDVTMTQFALLPLYSLMPHTPLLTTFTSSLYLSESLALEIEKVNMLFETSHFVFSIALLVFVSNTLINRKDF